MILFALWTMAVFWAVWNWRPWLWTLVCLIPLSAVSIGYYMDVTRGGDDPFGARIATPLLFLSMTLVVASSGILSMVFVHHPGPVGKIRRQRKTVFQRLFWSSDTQG